MATIDTSVPAVILKFVADPYAHGRLGAIRSLGRLGVPVYHLEEVPRTPVSRTRYGSRIAWDMELDPGRGTFERLWRLGDELGNRPVLVTTDDLGALFVDEYADELAEVFRFPRQPRGLATQLADKADLFQLCLDTGIPTPRCTIPRSRYDVEQYIDESLGFPVVIKSADPRLLRQRPQATSVVIADTPDELLDIYDTMEDFSAPNLMMQEFIPGGPETVWMFNGYFDAQSECLFASCGRKLRQRPPDTGPTTLGKCEANDEVEHVTRRFMKELGYSGIVDMGYRFDARDGTYKLLDVNPRMGATFRLFTDREGMDVVRAMYLDLTGQAVPAADPALGRKWLVEPLDLWSARSSIAAGRLSWGAWIRSLRGVDECAWLARDDLRPFGAMAAAFLADSTRSIRRRSPLRRSGDDSSPT